MRGGAPFALGAVSLLTVLAVLYADLDRAAPGPLSPVHGRLSELADPAGCSRCHGAWDQPMAAACGACHEEIAAQVAGATGFHGGLDEPGACDACHLEHHGGGVPLVTAESFAAAGFADRADYDHRGLGYALGGRHAELECAACHENADAAWIEPDQHRFLGAGTGCTDCHDDAHEGRYGQDCDSCHGQERPFPEAAAFEHAAAFPLEGVHGGLACASCHDADDVLASEPGAPREARACAACHDSPHRERFLAAAALDCGACHPTHGGPFARPDVDRAARWHAATGFPLDGPHAEVGCARCHGGAGAYRERHPGRHARDCAACHDDPHGGQFGAPERRDCADCHAGNRFVPAAFGPAEHAAAGFPLEGSHGALECADCHAQPDDGAERVFRGTPAACAACHDDAHAGAFAALPDAVDGRTGCARCHEPTRFDAVRGFDHAWAGFALDGAHARADCARCHPRAAAPDDTGRTFGRVADVFGRPATACATCHADPHGPAASGADVSDCAACHGTESFGAVVDFVHEPWSGFALRGAHARVDCADCHGRSAVPDARGRTLGRAAERFPGPRDRCATCHADPHGGAFDRAGTPATLGGRAGCARCHGEDSFRALRVPFDHGRFTGFALAGGHAALECAACHVRADEGPRAFAPAAGVRCADCHADPHAGQFAAPDGPAECARCHPAGARTFAELDFDHAARFALDEHHAALDCSACHRPWPLASGGEAVRYRPLGRTCADCHGVHVPASRGKETRR